MTSTKHETRNKKVSDFGFGATLPRSEWLSGNAQRRSGLVDAKTAQTFPRSDEYKEDLSSAAKRTGEYGERETEESDEVIAESGDGATGLAGWQVDVAREV